MIPLAVGPYDQVVGIIICISALLVVGIGLYDQRQRNNNRGENQ